ncbi:MAG: hypothetical protein BWY64_00405 [bacterium ADurb.Bin363]|nr:MAG: hypothetical protein BWY64_00405 [bacterium ADurb.Bin363]
MSYNYYEFTCERKRGQKVCIVENAEPRMKIHSSV